MKHKLKLNSKFMQGVMFCEVVKIYTPPKIRGKTQSEQITINKDGKDFTYDKESFEKSFNRSEKFGSFKIIKL